MFDATDIIDLRRPDSLTLTPSTSPAPAAPATDRKAEIDAWARHAAASNGFGDRPASGTRAA